MKVNLTSVKRVPLTSKSTGKPFTSLRITTQQHGDSQLSGFGNKDNEHWNVGMEVDIDVEQKGQYLNFSTAKGSSVSKADVKLGFMEQNMKEMMSILLALGHKAGTLTPAQERAYTGTIEPKDIDWMPNDAPDITDDDVPF